MRTKRVTSDDVAREVGVSRATVSYVLNNVDRQRISTETRERVKRVAAEMGYQPNAAARALRKGTSRIALVEVPYWPIGPAVADALAAIVTNLEGRGYTAVLHFERFGGGESLMRACARTQPLALVAPVEELPRSFVRTLRASGTAAILAFGETPSPYVPTMLLPQKDIGRTAIRYLADRSHRRVLAVMPSDAEAGRFRDARVAGAREEAELRGVALDVVIADVANDGIATSVSAAIGGRTGPTAIYAYNDEVAVDVLEMILDAGISVPSDIAVLGCDNSPLAIHARPRLSSIQLWTPKSWELAADVVHAQALGKRVGRLLVVDPPVVVERETT